MPQTAELGRKWSTFADFATLYEVCAALPPARLLVVSQTRAGRPLLPLRFTIVYHDIAVSVLGRDCIGGGGLRD